MNENMKVIEAAIEMLIGCFGSGGKLLVCGNGGSAADSAHIVGELVKGFKKKRPLPEEWSKALGGAPLQLGLPAIDLTAHASLITAVINDLGGDMIYAQQVLAYGKEGDVLIGITTSGNAANVALAAQAARLKGVKVIGMTGSGGGRLAELADLCIKAPENETYKVQECHIRYYHEICARVEEAFFPE